MVNNMNSNNFISLFWGGVSRRVTLASPAVRAAGGVNVGQLPFRQHAIHLPTAVLAARGPEAVSASAASKDTGITVLPAARVSQESMFSMANVLSLSLN